MSTYRVFSQVISDGTDYQLGYTVPSTTDFVVRAINLCNPTASSVECSVFYNKVIKGVELVSRTPVDVPSLPGVTHFTDAGLTSGGSDDGYWTLSLPFDAEFQGTQYSSIHVGTNSYITFGGGSTLYSSLGAATPGYNKIMIGAGDRASISMYFYTSPTEWWVRWEGNDNNSFAGSPMAWQIGSTLAEPNVYKFDLITLAPSIAGYSSTTGMFTATDSIGQFPLSDGVSFDLNANATSMTYTVDDLIGVIYKQIVEPNVTYTYKSGLILDPDAELLVSTDTSGLHITVFGAEL
jgi:hypothetical protein